MRQHTGLTDDVLWSSSASGQCWSHRHSVWTFARYLPSSGYCRSRRCRWENCSGLAPYRPGRVTLCPTGHSSLSSSISERWRWWAVCGIQQHLERNRWSCSTTSQRPPSLCSSSTVVRRQVSPGSQGLSSAGAPLLTHEDRRWSSSLGSSCPGPVPAVQNCEAGILARPASQYGRSSAPVWRSLSSLLGRRRDVTAPNDYTA